MTWIELLILFEIRTGNRTPSDITKPRFILQPLDRPPLIHEYLRSFQTATVKILTLISGNPEFKEMLTTNQVTGQRLRCIGTITNCVSTGFNTTVEPDEAKIIAKSLLTIIGKTTKEEFSQLYTGRLWKTLRAISFKKPPNWRWPSSNTQSRATHNEDGEGPPPPDTPDLPRRERNTVTTIVPHQTTPTRTRINTRTTFGHTLLAKANQNAFRIRCKPPCSNVHLRAPKPALTTPKPKDTLYARIL